MAVSGLTNRVSFTGNGVTTAFSFPYYFQTKPDLIVILKTIATGAEVIQVLDTNYTISGTLTNGVYINGGTVTMTVAPTSLQQLIIYREPALTQTVDLVENDPLPAETLEQALDKRAIIEQRLDERLDRTVRQRDGYTGSLDPQLPAIDVPLAALTVNAGGTGFEYTIVDAASLTAHIADPTDAHAASAITNTPSGNLAAADVQAALNELQTDIDGRQAGPLTGDVTTPAATNPATTIANSAVTNAKMADMAAATIKGRAFGAGTGAPTDLTGTQATVILDTFTSALKGLVPASGGGTTNFLRADGTFSPLTPSPLTTKGDLYTYSTMDTRLPVGTNGQVLSSDSAETTGLKWVAAAVATPTTSAISALDIDWSILVSSGGVYTKTLSANSTFTFSNLTAGEVIVVRLTNTASNYTVTWPSVKWPNNAAPTMTIGARSDIYTFIYDGTNVYGSYVQEIVNDFPPTLSAISASDIDWSLTLNSGGLYTKTLSANTTFTFSNKSSAETIVVRLTNTASNYTVTWPTVKWAGGTAPTMTVGAKSDVYTFVYDGTDVFGSYVQDMS